MPGPKKLTDSQKKKARKAATKETLLYLARSGNKKAQEQVRKESNR